MLALAGFAANAQDVYNETEFLNALSGAAAAGGSINLHNGPDPNPGATGNLGYYKGSFNYVSTSGANLTITAVQDTPTP